MPWQCRMISEPISADDYDRLRPGDMWIDDGTVPEYIAALVAPAHAGKRPTVVLLPGRVSFPIYGAASSDGKPWAVTGDPPLVTITPSIACHGVYHGYIRDGVITDDLDGRTYDDRGNQIRNGKPPG